MDTASGSGRFIGRTVIVTGAGSGIGRATAVRIAAEGGHVVAVDLDRTRLETLLDDCGPAKVTAVPADITDPASVSAIVAAAGRPVDGLANVAGIMDGFVPPSEVDDDLWDRVLAVNLTATMRLTREVLPAMIEAGRGSIVNVASEAALRPSAAAAYTASKHAVVGYTRSVAFFHGPQGIRANVVAPGAGRRSHSPLASSSSAALFAAPTVRQAAATRPAAVHWCESAGPGSAGRRAWPTPARLHPHRTALPAACRAVAGAPRAADRAPPGHSE